MDAPATQPPASPESLRRRCDRLEGQRAILADQRTDRAAKLEAVREFLDLAPGVEDALETLGQELFGRLARLIEEKLTAAIQEVLAQPIQLRVERDFKRGAATMKFHMERDGQREDIMKGQGGSVANILSVGLRLFALAQLDPKRHRRFLVLDEQDCWLAPDLVPRLVKIVRDAGRALGFQVIMISHHHLGAFEPFADRICRFVPTADGIKVEEIQRDAE